uniref:Uncharacterized protein n=1 Tax=Glossina morsitans morsitans TaxID=37546 RepID=A0A1B0G3X9_GLOMM
MSTSTFCLLNSDSVVREIVTLIYKQLYFGIFIYIHISVVVYSFSSRPFVFHSKSNGGFALEL